MVILWLMISDRARHELGSATLSQKCKVDLRQDALPFGHWMYLPFTFSVTGVILVPALPTLVEARLRFSGRYDHFSGSVWVRAPLTGLLCLLALFSGPGFCIFVGGVPIPVRLVGGSLSAIRCPPC